MNAAELALKMETDAVKFYSEAASKIQYEAGKKIFLSIAEDEKRHINMIRSILRDMDFKIGESKPVSDVKTIFSEMKNQMMQRVEATSDDLDALKIAMEMEKEGFEFYKRISTETPHEAERILFEMLAKEEEKHYSIFSNTYSFLADTGNWFMWEERSIVEG